MAANDVVSPAANDVPTVTFCCEICRRPVLVATIRIAPSIRQTGWRCARPACSPGRESTPVDETGVDVELTIGTATTSGKSRCPNGT